MNKLVDNNNFTIIEKDLTRKVIMEYYTTLVLMLCVAFINIVSVGISSVAEVNSVIIAVIIGLLTITIILATVKYYVHTPIMRFYYGIIKILLYIGTMVSLVFIVYNTIELFKLL